MTKPDGRLMNELAALGPFFAVDRHDRGERPAAPWRAMADLAEPGAALSDRVDRVRAALAAGARRDPLEVDPRVAVSVAHLGLVARLIAPAIGAAALGRGQVPVVADRLWWQDELGGPFPLSVALGEPESETIQPGTGWLSGSAVEGITIACRRAFAVSGRVLWGNVASAANSAAAMIGRSRPDLAPAARAAADAVLADVRVEGGRMRAGDGFRRRSCCLIYRLADSSAAVCGDCVLGAPTESPPEDNSTA